MVIISNGRAAIIWLTLPMRLMLTFPTLGIPVDGWYTSYLLAKVEIIISRQVKYLPEWLPETDSKRTARKWRSILQRFCDKPVKFEKRQMVRFEL